MVIYVEAERFCRMDTVGWVDFLLYTFEGCLRIFRWGNNKNGYLCSSLWWFVIMVEVVIMVMLVLMLILAINGMRLCTVWNYSHKGRHGGHHVHSGPHGELHGHGGYHGHGYHHHHSWVCQLSCVMLKDMGELMASSVSSRLSGGLVMVKDMGEFSSRSKIIKKNVQKYFNFIGLLQFSWNWILLTVRTIRFRLKFNKVQ